MPRQTPLNKIHKQLGARLVDFAGWEMPVQYSGVAEEHRAVRTGAGLFDVSHMGEIEIRGTGAEAFVQKVTCNDVSTLLPGQCQYSAFLTEQGTFVDDVIVNRLAPDRILICVNASNTDKDFAHLRALAPAGLPLDNASDRFFQIALQGPASERIASLAGISRLPPRPFTVTETGFDGHPLLIARTGYTGEDGFEIYGPPEAAETVWTVLMERGARPCGLGARDTLRLEAALSLYGHEIDDKTDPWEARLGWIVKPDKKDFVGREALAKRRQSPPKKRLVGIEMREPGIARQGCLVFDGDREIGTVTSGTKTPTLDKAIALAYVPPEFATVGGKIAIDIHNKKRHAVIVSLPFYKRP